MRLPKFLSFALAAALAAVSIAPLALAQKKAKNDKAMMTADAVLPPINYTEFTLPNGLRVILHEDHSTPIVGVNVWYHVGSKNEVPGRTGFAHLFEHMMFQGSKHYDENYFTPIQEAGGTLNGSTNSDRTNYWEVVPSNFLELALFMEADRMATLPDVLTQAKLDNQREVVKNEKRQNYDNRPYGLVGAKINEALYPPDHPYHWLTIGSLDDLNRVSAEDVKEFFRRYYVPNNASLCIAGDINPKQARQWVEKYFGAIKPNPNIPKVNAAQPKLEKEIRLTMEDRVRAPRLYMTWHTVPHFTQDEAALDTLAVILSGGRNSRLYKSLVYEKQIAQEVRAFNNSRELAGTLQIEASPSEKVSLADLEAAITAEIEKIKTQPPSNDEMERAYNAREARFIYSLQTVGGFGGKSDQLNGYETFVGKPGYFEQDLARFRRTTPADVQRVAREYLTDKKLVLTVKPMADSARPTRGGAVAVGQQQGEGAPPSAAESQSAPTRSKRAGSSNGDFNANLPKPQPDPQLHLPRVERQKLSNGLEVMIVRKSELPVVDMNLVIKTGAAADASGKAGLASMTASMLDEGTRTRTSLEIADALGQIGANLGAASGWDETSVQMLTLTRHLDRALEIYGDVITNPAFPAQEFARLQRQRAFALRLRRNEANAIANVAYSTLLYGREHPYGHPLTGDEKSLAAISPDDVKRFYETYFRPNNATLIVVGDVDSKTLLPKLEKTFAAWKPADVPAVSVTAPQARDKATVYLIDRPGAAQSVIEIGNVSVDRMTPDYFPLLVLNSVLGGQFISRINLNLREDKGYTYGARSQFEYRRGAGPFIATAGVETRVTKESVAEFLKEINDIRGKRPVTPAELEYAKQAIIRGFPRGFETPAQIAGRLSDVALYNLPDDYFNTFTQRVRAVTIEDVNRVAQKYLDPSRMAILVVGDRKTIEPGLRSLADVGQTLTLLDAEGRPVTTSNEAGGGVQK